MIIKKVLFYNDQQQINLAYVSLKGKVKFEKDIEVDANDYKKGFVL